MLPQGVTNLMYRTHHIPYFLIQRSSICWGLPYIVAICISVWVNQLYLTTGNQSWLDVLSDQLIPSVKTLIKQRCILCLLFEFSYPNNPRAEKLSGALFLLVYVPYFLSCRGDCCMTFLCFSHIICVHCVIISVKHQPKINIPEPDLGLGISEQKKLS